MAVPIGVLTCIPVCCILGWYPARVNCIPGSERFHDVFYKVSGVLYRGGSGRIPSMVHYLAARDVLLGHPDTHKTLNALDCAGLVTWAC